MKKIVIGLLTVLALAGCSDKRESDVDNNFNPGQTVPGGALSASPSDHQTNENTPYSASVPASLNNQLPPPVYSVVNQPLHGTLNLNSTTGAYTYTPNVNYSGPDFFTWQVTQGSESVQASVNIQVVPVNLPPVANNLVVTATEDTPLTGALTGTDPNGDLLTFIYVSGPSYGTLVINPGGTFTYTPSPNYNGPDSFTFQVSDGVLTSPPATVTVNVTPINDTPVANNSAISTPEDTPYSGNLNANDLDGDSLTYAVGTNPSHGSLALNPSTGAFVYTPNLHYNGPDSFTFTVNDGTVSSSPATVSINVTPVNDPPIAISSSFTTPEDIMYSGTLGGVDPDGDLLNYILTTTTSKGFLQIQDANLGTFTYTPYLNQTGTDSFTFKVNDGSLDSPSVTVFITITPVNDDPVAHNSAFSIMAGDSHNGSVLATDVDSLVLTYALVTNPTQGSLTFNSDGTYVYTANPLASGTDSFTFKANDGALDSNIATVNITIGAVNQPPVANNATFTLPEDSVGSGTLVGTDPEGSLLTYIVVTSPTHGVLVVNPDGSFTYTPETNYNGSDSFTFKVNDGENDSNTATVTLNVTPVNDLPVASNASYTILENQVLPMELLASDVDGDSLTYIIVAGPSHGTLTGSGSSRVYTPNLNYSGPDSFTFKVNDGSADSNEATVSINITFVNHAPVADNQTLSTPEDTPLSVTLTASDVDGDTLTYTVVSGPTNGVLTGSGNNYTYTPNANYNGPDSFTFKANDGSVDSNTATVSISVSPVNDAPVAHHQSLTTPEETPISITLTGSDVDGDTLIYTVVDLPSHGTLSGSGVNYTYTPNLNYNGTDSFTFKVNDGTTDSATAIVAITVTPVNDAPTAQGQSVTTLEDTPLVVTLVGTDPDGDPLTYIIVSPPTHGTFTLVGNTLTYTPDPNYNGPDSFTFKVNDGTEDSNTVTVAITVDSVNDIPVADNQSVTTPEDTQVDITLVASDVDGDVLTYSIVDLPQHGTVVLVGNVVTYIPDPDYFGSDSFTFKVNDGTVDSNTATVSINVTSENDTPVANNQTVTTDEDTAVNITLIGSDTDGDVLTYSIIDQPVHGVVTLVDNVATYVPNLNYNGSDSFTFKVNDGTVDSNTATVSITVTPINDAPVVQGQSVTTPEDTALNITLVGTDVDGDSLTYTIVSGPTNGTLSGTGANVIYTPNSNYFGPDSFTFKVNDGTVDSNTATISINVTSENDLPVANNQSLTTPEDTALNITLTGTDADGDALTYIIVNQPVNGVLSGSGANIIYTPNLNYNGTDSFTFKVNDGTGDSAEATISLTVTPVNDIPVANNQSVSTPEDTPLNITLTGSDVDGDSLTYVVVSGPANGTLSGSGANLIYTPNLDYVGSDSFTFKVNDGQVDSPVATVSITVTGVNDTPVAQGQSVTTPEDTPVNILLVATDSDGDVLTYIITQNPAHGSLVQIGPDVTYVPNLNYNGADSFKFKVNDGTVDSSEVTVSINVTPVNDAPVANNSLISVGQGQTHNGNMSAFDVEGDPLTYTVVTSPTKGTFSYNSATGEFTYTAFILSNGQDTFTFKVNDGSLDSNTATVTININTVNFPPVANNQTLTTLEDIPVNSTLTYTDLNLDAVTFTIVAQPSQGTLVVDPFTGAFTYTPNLNYEGPDFFTFKVNDGTVDSNTATVTINVTPVNDTPVANNQSVTTPEDTSVNITLTGSDVEGSPLTYTIVDYPVNGNLSGSGTNYTYTPNANYHGSDSFTFKVNDGVLDSSLATVAITVTPVNDVPVADNQSLNINEDTPLNVTLTATDADGDTLTYIIVSGPANGVLSGSGANVIYTPNANYHGSDSFTFKVNDGTVDSNTATISINVDSINDVPVAQNQTLTTPEDTPLNIILVGTDADGDSLTYIIVSGPTNGTLSGTGSNITYTPNANYFGSDSFTFKVNDGTIDSNVATVSINVTSVNDVPVAQNQSVNTPEDTDLLITLVGTDSDGDPLTYIIVDYPTNGIITLVGNDVTYVPSPNYHGPDSFTFKVNDGTVDSNTATVSITVDSVNDVPVALAQSVTTPEDTAVNITLVGTDEDGDVLTYTVVSGPTNGTLSGSGANLIYTPNANYHGGDSFTFKVNDGTADSNVATVSITVDSINDLPVADNQSVTTDEDTAVNVTLTASDADGDTLTYTVVTGPTNGTLSGSGSNLVYTPNANYHGSDSFTFKVNDGTAGSNTAVVSITVNSVNDTPVASGQSISTPEDTPVDIVLTGSDNDGDVLTYIIVDQPLYGTLVVSGNNVTYIPDPNYFGSDSFSYKVNDGTVDSNTAIISLNVTPVNDIPVAQNQSVNTPEDTSVLINLIATDADGDVLTYIIVDYPQHGIITLVGNDVTYVPSSNYHGPDSFTFKVNDGTADSNTATVSITVDSVNDTPVANNQSVTTDEDTAVNITLTASDADGDSLTYTVVSGPTNGTLSGSGSNLIYTPNSNYFGSDSFTFKVNDGTVDSNVASVVITVNSVNDTPVANNQSVTTSEDTPLNITLTASDADGDSLTYTVVSGPANGTLSGSGSNLVYTPNTNYHGPDSFTFKVNDGTIDSNTATVSISVDSVNDAPVAYNQTVTTPEDTQLEITLVGTDADGDPLTYIIVDQPLYGTVILTGNNVTYIPDPNYFGPDSFTYKVNDGTVDSNVATIAINVDSINDTPVANNQSVTTPEDTAVNITLIGSDADGDTLTYTVISGPTNGVLSGSGANLTYTPNLDYNGTDSFTFKVNDGTVDSNTATVSITVTPVNDAPVAQNQSVNTNEDTAANITLVGSDVDGDTLTYTIVSGPTNGILSGSGANIVYTPNANYYGADSFTFKVNDGTVDSNTATVSITVDSINDLPVASNQNLTTDEDTALNITLTGTDADGDTLTYIIVDQPLHGILSGSGSNIVYTPNANYNGSDSFTYKVNDGTGDSNTATIAITVNPVNDAPVAYDQNLNTDENESLDVTLTGSDVDGNTLTYVVVAGPSHGTLVGTGANLTYVPDPSYNGPDSFTYKVNDGTVDSNVATIAIYVSSVNDVPVAQNQSVTTTEDTQLEITLVGTDIDGDTLTYIIVTYPSHGTLIQVGNDVTYIPNGDYNGPDSFTFKVNDGTVDSNTATVSINITPVNDAPIADNQNVTTDEDTAVNITLTGSDVEGSPLTYTVVSGPTNGVLSGSGANLTYTPNANYHGSDSFTFKVNDGSLDSNTATVAITVNSINDAPVANNQSVTTPEDTALNISLTASDADGDTLTYVVISGPTNGTLSGSGANVIYTPNLNYNGPDSFTFKVNDGTVDSAPATVSINVTPVNDLPVAYNQSVTTPEDTPLDITLVGTDADGDTLTYLIVDQPLYGTLVVSGNEVTYIPDPNYFGPDSFTYKVNDGTTDSNVATIAINVDSVNDIPVANNQSVTTPEDIAVNITLTASDADGDALTYTIVSGPTNGVLSGGGANLVYTPNANYHGTDSFTFKVNDGTVDSNTATVSITVDSVNDIPVANNQNLSTPEDTALNITLTGSDVDGDVLTYIIVDQPLHGTLSGSGANIVYTPNTNYNGSDSFTFKVNDGSIDSNVATISLNVTPVNDLPVANSQNVNTNEDTPLNITLTGSDADGDTLTYIIVDQPTNGTLSGSGANIVYSPNADYHGTDSFTFKVNDGNGDSNVATVAITVNSVNDLPVAYNQSLNTNEDTALNITLTGTDVDGDSLTYIVVSGPTHGVLSGSGANLVYTPNANYFGSDSFTYKVNDGTGDSNTATISINVNSVNDLPVAQDQSVTTPEDTNLLITLVGTDLDGDSLTYIVVSNPTNGTINLVGNDVTYVPNPNYHGSDSFTFKVNDGTGDSNTATVAITVTPVNDAPVANNSSFTTLEDTAHNGTVTGSDVEGSPLTFSVVTNPTKGVVVLNPNGTYTYTPNSNEFGTDSFTFKANDGDLDSNVATVSITITPVNDLPVAQGQSVTTPEDTNLLILLTGTDADGDTLSYIIVSNPTHGTLVQVGPDITYIPDANYNGSDSFTFKVNDGTGDSNVATVAITVTPVNDLPVANNQSISTNKNQAKTGTVVATDIDGDTLTYSIVANPSNGTVSLNSATGFYTYTPNNNFTGSDSFTFRAFDGTGYSNTATVSITVVNPNQAPIAMDQNLNGTEDTTYNGNMPAWDPDGDPITWTVLTQPNNGTLTYNTNTGTFAFVPELNYFGVVTFTYKVNDGQLDSPIATITITLQAINDLPISYAQSVTVNQNSSNNPITLVGSDVETPEPSLIYSVVVPPQHGTLSSSGKNVFYTPHSNYAGPDSFTFKVNDGQYDSNVSTVSITVNDLGGWCDTSFAYMHKLVLNNQDQSSSLTNFPVMVKLNSTRVNYADIKAGGADLRFFDSNCNLLAYEIERWNTSGDSTIWVKVPSIAASSNASFIWMGYGKPSATDAQNKNAVWDSNYVGVWHQEETSGNAQDSTSYANHMVPQGSIVRNTAGKIAGANLFNSNDDRFSAANSNSLKMTTSSSFTLETWVYSVSNASNSNIIEKQYNATDGNIDYGLYLVDGYPHMRARKKSLQYNTRIPQAQWVHMTATFNASSNTCIIFINGVQKASSSGCSDDLLASGTMPLYLGGDQGNRNLNGAMDETRISNIVRSPDWIRAQHLSMTDGMVSYGTRRVIGENFKHILMTIKTNNDDGYVRTGNSTRYASGSSGVDYMGVQSARPNWGYYRFQLPSSIPAGAVIKTARLRLFGRDASGSWTNQFLVLTAQNVGNASQITAASQYPGGSLTTVGTGMSWGAPGLNWAIDEWNQSPNFKDVIIDLKNAQGGLSSGNYIQLWVTKGAPYGNLTAPIISADIPGNINYFLGLSADVTVPTSPLINIGVNSNLLSSLGLGNLQICILNLIGINCSNSENTTVGAEDNNYETINHAQLMIEYE